MTSYWQRRSVTGTSGEAMLPAQPAGFLSLLASKQRISLLELGSVHLYRRGQALMREGGPADVVIVVVEGLARVTTVSEDGKEILLGLRGSGDLLGEMGALSSSKVRSATVTAATPLRGCSIRAVAFVAFLERNPQVANRVSDVVASKLRAANRRRLEFNAYPAEARVAGVLAEVAVAYGHRDAATWRIGPEITQADLASLASASVRTIEKILHSFEADGIVARRRRDLIVTDLQALDERRRSLRATRSRRDY